MTSSVFNFDSYQTIAPTEHVRGKWVAWGEDDDYPEQIYRIATECPQLNAILQGSIDFTIGAGFDCTIVPSLMKPSAFKKFVRNIVSDMWYFGGFAFAIYRAADLSIQRVDWIDLRACRVGEDDSRVFVKLGKDRVNFPRYKGTERVEVYYYEGNKTRDTYPVIPYSPAIIFAQTALEIGRFHYSAIRNNFNPSGIIKVNGYMWDDNQRAAFESNLRASFTGADSAGKCMVVYGDLPEQTVEFSRYQEDNLDNKYNALAEAVRENIFIGCRAMPQLFGMHVASGFSDIEYAEAYDLYYKSSVAPVQQEVNEVLKEVFNTETDVVNFKMFYTKPEGNGEAAVVGR